MHSEESKKKIGTSVSKSWTKERRQKQSELMKRGKALWMNSFIKIPSQLGRERSVEHCKKLSISKKGKKIHTTEYKERLREEMKNGKAAYLNKFIKNPSKPELKLREIVKSLFPSSEPTKIMNYCIDIGIPEHKIAIEFDGYYHFCDQEHIDYHKKRQEEIEKEGWRFIRYNIFQEFPTIEKVSKDIEDCKNGRRN